MNAISIQSFFSSLTPLPLKTAIRSKGQNAYHPRLIVSILIYAYSRGVFSSRQIESTLPLKTCLSCSLRK